MQNFISSRPWRTRPAPSLTVRQKQWLTRPGALTTALRTLGNLKLRVIAEYPAGARPDEAHRLGVPARSPVWIREVIMDIGQVECVVARSVTPLSDSHGVWQGVRRLRSKPLADLLYDDVSIVRSNFEVARLRRQTPLFRTVKQAQIFAKQGNSTFLPILARRSVFWRRGSPLLVAECFLPEFWTLF